MSLRRLRQHRLELGVNDVQFVDALAAVGPLILAVVGAEQERIH
ncbi:Uncharacterised protein [Mycobacterium tuberculosis]|uniref:Uncharacterized protein n=1 Tax=Mycobacterium tuberculosis TaxID=1773 RepID=A0A916LDF8_MYCTX|nr:Uncharacterised protein [Mycobacterium tuberculosis]COZ16497.1 Uncharacterised protein [Mycobacterium tuberculosis]COZ25949.1 Uncharacterised protein [Mycobacterium tuberculosis]